jgi:hypothetical protein
LLEAAGIVPGPRRFVFCTPEFGHFNCNADPKAAKRHDNKKK